MKNNLEILNELAKQIDLDLFYVVSIWSFQITLQAKYSIQIYKQLIEIGFDYYKKDNGYAFLKKDNIIITLND